MFEWFLGITNIYMIRPKGKIIKLLLSKAHGSELKWMGCEIKHKSWGGIEEIRSQKSGLREYKHLKPAFT